MSIQAIIPPHVPSALVRDFDFLQAEQDGDRDLYEWWAELHDGPDIFYTPRHGGHWVLTRHDDISHVLETWQSFSSRHQTIPAGGTPMQLPPIELDPPLHTDFRRLLAPFFTPKAIGDLEIKARKLTIELIEKFEHKGECDFVAEFALAMPIGIFMGLVDLPESDRLQLIACAELMVRGVDEAERAKGFGDAFAYLGRVIEERRANPGDDAISAMIRGTVEGGRPLTQAELLGMGALLLAGGLDTVAGMMGFMMMFLARNPAHRQALVNDPALIPQAVEELMRRHQIANVARMVVDDIEYKGVQMKAGDMVLTATSLAGVDERRYDDPMKVDFARADKKSLVFGRGPHQCIGAFLARTELKVFLAEWLQRIPDFAIKPGEKPVVVPGRANSVHYLPLVWDVAR